MLKQCSQHFDNFIANYFLIVGICEVSQNALSSESVKTVQHISTDEKAVSIACESPQTTENNLSTKLLQDSGVQPGSPNEMYVELGVQPLSSTPTKLLPNLEMNHTDDQQSMTGMMNLLYDNIKVPSHLP